MHPLSVTDVAQHIGCATSTVRRHASQHGIGAKVGPVYAFTVEDRDRIAGLVREAPGNPEFAMGNDGFVTQRKKSAKLAEKRGEPHKKPGRPKKATATAGDGGAAGDAANVTAVEASSPPVKRKRGRPKKNSESAS